MVPHSWLVEVMKILGVSENVQNLLKNSMDNWKTVLNCGDDVLGEVEINRGIFQGDSLSPLLFIMCLIPLSSLLNNERTAYEFSVNKEKINHLLFMDDLKLYGKNEKDINTLLEIVKQFSDDIGMEFGFEKCGVLVIKKGKKEKISDIVLPNGEAIREVDEHGYKYLGILESDNIMHKEMKDKIRSEYFRRLKVLVKSKLYANNLFKAINTWAVSIVRYGAGIINWSKKELREMDIKTRKILTMNGIFHKRSSTDRLYMKRTDGGRGLIGIKECVDKGVQQLEILYPPHR